eukprot:TRINITY_DN30284_c0_g1_i1.p1 TRINITY_DN30284_c0_g1~~TRINITY_DN30284_c0_g1_i1.p1  ORF type:complete len:100 (+),score=1.67 TRINITY_DN30284_c0_g1_i1:209-508(+)
MRKVQVVVGIAQNLSILGLLIPHNPDEISSSTLSNSRLGKDLVTWRPLKLVTLGNETLHIKRETMLRMIPYSLRLAATHCPTEEPPKMPGKHTRLTPLF